MPAANYQSSKVSSNELSSSTKFNNFVQAVQDLNNAIDNANVAAAAAIAVSKLAAGSNDQLLKTVSGIPTWVSAVSTYVPVWSSTGTQPAIGNGSIAGRYFQIGKLVWFDIAITMGSTSTFGTGPYRLTIPVAAETSAYNDVTGWVRTQDASAVQTYMGSTLMTDSTHIDCVTLAAPVIEFSSAAPFTWATSDIWRVTGWYEAA